ncbi:unnamed protein product [Echinostoma caproni]|uniref:WAPL domain-containing protein n=1 Tax=Echinostoma caproni TaxID=27848 RepID=A0A183ASV8_9TREM|nr:unnamed protein product [Echinostoma caproni]
MHISVPVTQPERPQTKPPPVNSHEIGNTMNQLSNCGIRSNLGKASVLGSKNVLSDAAASAGPTSVGVKTTIKSTFGAVHASQNVRPVASVARINRFSTTLSPSFQNTQGTQVHPPKPLTLSRASTSPFPSANSNSAEESSDSKRPVRTLLCGKNKRAAYNPRPWQEDIDAEDGSPTKAPKMAITSWPESSASRTSSQLNTSTRSSSFKPTNPHSSGLCDRPSWTRSSSSATDSLPRSGVAKSFDFPDSDSDLDEAEDVLRRPQQISITSTVNVSRMPKLSRLIGTPSPELSSLSNTSRPTSSCIDPQSTNVMSVDSRVSGVEPSEDEHENEINVEEEDEDNDEDEEEDDVKPWFRPASRDAVEQRKKPQTNTELASNRVNRTQKPLYTVVQKVKEAHVCQERGETQHLLDDVEYLVDGLADHNQTNTRALSVLTLANKCLAASFRYMVNAHGLIKRICTNLHDAHKDYTLALTSAGLFFILSRDRDPNVFDAESLAVVLKILSAPDSMVSSSNGINSCLSRTNKEAERVRARVRQLLDGLQQQQNSTRQSSATLPSAGNSVIVNPNIGSTNDSNAADLVLESILNLGTRKAADWFKAELRHGGGLDRVADAAADAVDYLADLDPDQEDGRGRRCPKSVWRSYTNPTGLDSFALDKLRRVCHYTKLLENMTYMNSDNQTYLVRYRDRLLVNRLLRCVRLCASHLPKQPLSIPPPASTSSSTASANTGCTEKTSLVKTGIGSTSGISSQPNDQSILVDCILGIFRFLVNVSHNGGMNVRLAKREVEGDPIFLKASVKVFKALENEA